MKTKDPVVRIALVIVLLAAFPSLLSAQAGAASAAARGKDVFDAKCASCHTVGGGDLVGPDLAGVTTRRDARWLTRFIRRPDVVIREKDPIALELLARYSGVPMPNLGIGESEVASLMAYLAAGGGATAQAAPGAAAQPSAAAPPEAASAGQLEGNAATGAALFDGTRPFHNRGTQCFACHTLGSISPPGGGTLGPDLTQASRKFGGPPGMIAVLSHIPFPTMIPVYRDHPLLPQEQADIAAYLGASSGGPSAMTVFVVCLAVWVMAGLYMILHFLWRRRLGHVRSSLQAR